MSSSQVFMQLAKTKNKTPLHASGGLYNASLLIYLVLTAFTVRFCCWCGNRLYLTQIISFFETPCANKKALWRRMKSIELSFMSAGGKKKTDSHP